MKKRKTKKPGRRILSSVLTVVLVMGLIPGNVLTAYAAEELSITIDTGISVTLTDADNDGYYDIGTADELYAFAEIVNGGNIGVNGELISDITVNSGDVSDCKGINAEGWREWFPIGYYYNRDGDGSNEDVYYYGTFNGNGKTISGLYFNNESQSYVGFFGQIEANAKIANLGIVNSYFKGDLRVGGVCGLNRGEITNCYYTGTVEGDRDTAGGLCGELSGTVSNCYNICIEGETVERVCGLMNQGNITNCYYLSANETDDVDGTTFKTQEQFASGEVAYLLNGDQTTITWYQTIDTDILPVLNNTHSTVYYGYENCRSTEMTYANTELSDEIPDHDWKYELDGSNTGKVTFVCATDGCTSGGTVTLTAPTDATYNKGEHEATVAVETENGEELIKIPEITYDSLTNDVELVNEKPVNAGRYKAGISFGEGEHKVTAFCEYEIAKTAPFIKNPPTAEAITYGETLGASALSDGEVKYSAEDEATVEGTWNWKQTTIKPTVADSDATQYDVVFTPADEDNYDAVETAIALTVNKSDNIPNKPESTMNALYGQRTVGAVELPEGWIWIESDSGKELAVGKAVEATAIYNGADKGNYITESVSIVITRQECDHTYADPTFSWSEDGKTCSVTFACKNDATHIVVHDAVVTGKDKTAATCKNKGTTTYTATYTDTDKKYSEEGKTYTDTKDVVDIPADKENHTGEIEVKDAKEATCGEDGYSGDTYCKDCSTKIAIGTKIAKTTVHTWDGGVVTKEATFTEKGEKTYTCSACKITKTEEISALVAPKVGTEITSEDGSATYKVTVTGKNGNAVTYEAPTDKNATIVVVPATVTINNITYNVTAISDTAFADNKKLTTVTIGDGVTSIPANAFKNFKKLVTVKMGIGVKTIGKNAFYGCSKLKSVTIGKNVSKIGAKAFYDCKKLKTLTIKSTKLTSKKIGKNAFGKTPKSMKVTLPKKKFKSYKSMLRKKGVNKKAKFKKAK